MDSFELNKILGAILGTLLFVMGLGFIAEAIYAPHAAGPGYNLPAPSEENPNAPTQQAAVVDIGTLLAKADPKAGEDAAKKCAVLPRLHRRRPEQDGPKSLRGRGPPDRQPSRLRLQRGPQGSRDRQMDV